MKSGENPKAMELSLCLTDPRYHLGTPICNVERARRSYDTVTSKALLWLLDSIPTCRLKEGLLLCYTLRFCMETCTCSKLLEVQSGSSQKAPSLVPNLTVLLGIRSQAWAYFLQTAECGIKTIEYIIHRSK